MTDLCLIFLASFLPSLSLQAQEIRSPNVVILFADDAGYADFGFQPNCDPDYQELTPHIDSIAANGARVTSAYMCGAVCSPSRAGLMTGRYPQRFGYDNNLPPGFPSGLSLKESFGAKRLSDWGYRTGLIGKWHLGYPEDYHPNKRGFDEFWGLLQGSRSYYPLEAPSINRRLQFNGEPQVERGYVTDRFGEAACEFLDRNHAKPFFLFVSFTAPHGPLQPRRGESDAARVQHIEKKKRRKNAGLIAALDDNVGKVLQRLEDLGIVENTLVIFTNDNGGALHTGAINTPLRGGKGDFYEGGIRVPWCMQWPAVLSPESVIEQPLMAFDIVPTIIEMSGQDIPDDAGFDGQSFLSYLKEPEGTIEERTFYWRKSGSQGPIAMREGDWKMVFQRQLEGSVPELYHLGSDLDESEDVASIESSRCEMMLKKALAWEGELVEPLWGRGSKDKPVKRRR